ncbi:MAG: hypothetical protein ABSA18_01895 [Dehalococcoidia bacterium]|jgi:phenylacetate-coenzyme A ligase PaaK-like adenylate-forming protein
MHSEIEVLPRKDLDDLKRERLLLTIKYAYDNSPFYHNRFKERGITPGDVRDLSELIKKMGIVNSADLIEHQGDTWLDNKFMSVTPDRIWSANYTSGSRGKNKVAWRSDWDWAVSKEKVLRAYCAASIGVNHEVLLDLLPMGINISGFSSSLATHPLYGDSNLPITILTAGTDPIVPLATLIAFHRPTAVIGAASTLLQRSSEMKDQGVDVSSIKIVITVGEASSTEKRSELRRRFNDAQVFDLYASDEADAMAYECAAHDGLHVSEDYLFLSSVDPATYDILPTGVMGMDLLTTLIDEKASSDPAMIMLNYHQGDGFSVISYDRCSCGRTFMRISHPTRFAKGVFDVGYAKLYESDVKKAVDDNGYSQFGITVIEKDPGRFDVIILIESAEPVIDSKSVISHILEGNAGMTVACNNGIANVTVLRVKPDCLSPYLGKKRSEREIDAKFLKELL